MSNRAWVTLATNDSYGLGALVLAHSLRRASSAYPSVVLITPSVTEPMRDRLRAVFADVITVDVLDSRDAAHLALLQRPELGITFTKIHCWNLTQYEKCVFLDADTLIIQNCDELFEREELSAAPDVGWPDCFNSGVFVFRPSVDTFNDLIKFAQERGSFDGGDQGLLNSFFKDWAHGDINKHLPFLYNVTSAAFYSYLPALKHYGQNLKIIHFIGAVKPWLQQFNWETRTVSAPDHLRELLQLWWDLFVSQVHSELDVAMVEAQEAQPDEPGVAPQDLSHYFHYQPIVNPESEFPWHHPDAQIHEEGSEPQIDMSDIHNPWQIYRGHIPPSKDDTSRRHSELGGGVNYEEIRKYAWDYQMQRNQPASHVQDTFQSYEQNVHSQHESYQQPYHDEHKHNHEDHQHHDQHQHYHFQHDHDHHHHHEQHQQHHDQQQYRNEHPQHHHDQHQQDHRHYEHVEHHWQPDQVHTYHDDHSHRVYEQSRVQEESWHQDQSQDNVHNYSESNQHSQCNGHKDVHNHDLHYEHSSHTHTDHHSHNSSQTHNETYTASKPYEHNTVTHTQSKEVGVYHVHLDHVSSSVRKNIPPENNTQVMNGDISETESEFHEEVKPRHPYDGFYLRHRATIDSHGRKICSHEIPFLPPTPPESPLPEDDLVLESEDILPTSDYDEQTGVAGNLARVAAGGAAREAVDELTRRQGWEAGHIDYMGADSFDNIWAKISRTLNQREPQPEAPAPVPAPEIAEPVVEAPAAAPKPTDAPAPEKTEPTPADAPAAIPVETPVKVSSAAPVNAPVPIETAAEPVVVPATVKAVSAEAPKAPEAPAPVAAPIAVAPVAAAPVETAPVAAAPVKATPIESTPVAAAPVKAAPVETAPVAAATVKAAPVESAPVAAAPVKAAPVETAPAAPASVATPVPIETPPPSPVPVIAPTEIPKTVEAVEAAALKETAKESTAKTENAKAPAEVAAPAVIAKSAAESEVPKAATPEKASDSPPLANTPSKEAPPLPAAKSEERRKPAGKLQLRPPAAADPLPTPDSEQEDAASLASSIIAGELRTPTVTPASASPPAPSHATEAKRLSVEGPEVPTPPIGAVSLAQIGVKPAAKGKASTAAHIESSITEGTEAPKKKLVKKVVKKEVAPGDAPVPPPRKKEKKPKDK